MFAFILVIFHAIGDINGWMNTSLFQVALSAALFSLCWGAIAFYKYNNPNGSESPLFDDQNTKPTD